VSVFVFEGGERGRVRLAWAGRAVRDATRQAGLGHGGAGPPL